jgi:hypothetical protein
MESRERETEVYKGNKMIENRKLERKITAHIPSTIASSVTKDCFFRTGRQIQKARTPRCSEFQE